MAIDNLNFYSNWLPAGQLTDRYSSQPWCLKSKNLDIFSSSKSTKATAWSTPTQWDADVIKQDWKLLLKTDWKVYERTALGDVLVVDPSVNFPIYQVSYTWEWWDPEAAQRWTPTAMSVATEWNDWKSFVVYTDRASYVYSKVPYTLDKTIAWDSKLTSQWYYNRTDGYKWTKSWSTGSYADISIKIENPPMAWIPIRIKATEPDTTATTISLNSITVKYPYKYYYDAQTDSIQPYEQWAWTDINVPFTWNITDEDWITVIVPIMPNAYPNDSQIKLDFDFTKRDPSNDYSWSGWWLYVNVNGTVTVWTTTWTRMMTWYEWDYNEYYTYLPLRNRDLKEVWVYGYSMTYWMKWVGFQPLYKWISSWADTGTTKKIRYDFVTDMWWETAPWMDIIWMTIWNEQVYMIWNMGWDGYIIPCDLSWWVGTPYVAYGCTFKWVANIDYLMYLVWEDRGISQLWVYNWQELVAILWGTEEKSSKNLIDNTEQYKFDWKMVEYRDDLILSTSDHRIFAYWQTFWGKGWAFIHELPWTIKELRADWNDLTVKYTVSSTDYVTTLQDDTPIKNYNTEWMAEYPIALWNHLLEKEESDLYCSYILPSANTSLEFWGMANHYHFWTFTSSDSYTFSTTASYKMKGCTWNYALKYIETNGNQYTFRLEWDLPVQTTNDMKITDTEWTELITYSEYNHFRKIGEITTTEYQEWEFRFHNLNNKLELPKSHSLQIMVKGKGTANYTPELFALDLVANQRDRW